MAKIFTLQDYKIIIEPSSLKIQPFSDIWNKDKSKNKEDAINKITYIWYFADYDSPFFNYDEEVKDKYIKETILQNLKFKVSQDISDGIEIYKKLNLTPAMEMLDASLEVVNKIKKYFKTVDFTLTDNSGKFLYDIKEVTDVVTKLPKLTESINSAKDLCNKEKLTIEKVKGDKTLGMFEE